MIRTTRCLIILLLFAALAGGAGCATVTSGGTWDVHGSAKLAGTGPRMLVAGPALLMHVDLDGREELPLYTVTREQGADADCASTSTGEPMWLRGEASNHVNLAVARDQSVCIAAPHARASILWHTRKDATGPVQNDGETVAMRGTAR